MRKHEKITHIPCSPGIAIGKAYILTSSKTTFEKYWVTDKEVTDEITRFRSAVNASKDQLEKIKDKLCKFRGHDQIQILESHGMLLQDEMLVATTIQNIVDYRINAEWALDKTLTHLKMVFADLNEEYFQERKDDIIYIGQRIIKNLMGGIDKTLQDLPEQNTILVAPTISPAEVASFNKHKVKGFVTEQGSKTSHTAIIARSLEMPAVIGIENITNIIENDDILIIDGSNGILIINPTEKEIEHYNKTKQEYEKVEKILLKDIHLPSKTIDDRSIELVANIELLEEIPSALQHGAEGIGLYRTEYLFINRVDIPSEEEQFENYKQVLQKMEDRPVTIRILDIGGDKLLFNNYENQTNPALGLRGIRFCLKETGIFKTQLRALLRASTFGNLHMMLPMISSIFELDATKKIIIEVKDELKKQGERFNPATPLGIMVEIPSAAIMADVIAEQVDFMSIGTNDLIQYTLGIDRTNEHVSYLYNPFHPSILRLLKFIIDASKYAQKPISLCGEMAGDPLYLVLLIGLGLDSLSMNPISIPLVKNILRKISFEEARKLVNRVISLTSVEEIGKIVKRETKKIIPSYVKTPTA